MRREFKTIGLVIAMSASFGLAQVGTPGWEYGRGNCGPVSPSKIKSLDECTACCQAKEDASLNDPTWTPGETSNCKKYCAAVFGTPYFPGGPAGY